MNNHQPKLRKGNYYYLINLANDLALSLPETERYAKDPIQCEQLEPENIRQVWMIEEVQPHTFEIVHAISTLVVENKDGSCKLQFGKQKSTQLFEVKFIEGFEEKKTVKIWLKEKGKSLKYLHWSSSGLRFREVDFNDKICQWELLPVKRNQFIDKTTFISSFSSHYCLDVPEASEKLETQIIQYPCNYRFNQKWILKKTGEFFCIMNAKSKLYLDIKGESKKQGTPIIQYTFHGKRNQLWRLEEQGKNVYLIRSAMDHELLMSVKENSLKESADIVTSKYEVGSFWLITGFIPV